jgi:hypothetical protein
VDLVLAGIPELLQPIEELVGLVIEPEGRSFSEGELARHGWPQVDLVELDSDWA